MYNDVNYFVSEHFQDDSRIGNCEFSNVQLYGQLLDDEFMGFDFGGCTFLDFFEVENTFFNVDSFIECTFNTSSFEQCIIKECEFVDCKFKYGFFKNVEFENCRFTNCEFIDFNFVFSSIVGSKIEDCNFQNVIFSYVKDDKNNVWDNNKAYGMRVEGGTDDEKGFEKRIG